MSDENKPQEIPEVPAHVQQAVDLAMAELHALKPRDMVVTIEMRDPDYVATFVKYGPLEDSDDE